MSGLRYVCLLNAPLAWRLKIDEPPCAWRADHRYGPTALGYRYRRGRSSAHQRLEDCQTPRPFVRRGPRSPLRGRQIEGCPGVPGVPGVFLEVWQRLGRKKYV